ncbi:hypothetical protein K458DRAFT_368164 [Lentithecium fluviatile CBS 122367]|uniref:Transcription initiation factor TFIID subunit 4 n=1 Tax=Lentithecium fluviatile CBS 122367 TaxID=1168545 RepID=A0A6G1J0M5_9PLEO|nr:hypothetical protein K458DRAFT_368164 [Lentithecium fluviatile CBS 122367]
MANPQYNQYSQHQQHMPPLQTQNHGHGQRPFSPPSYQQSPGAMSPTAGGIPPAKRQRLSPQPGSPAYSPFSASPYQTPTYATPYATSPSEHHYLHKSPTTAQPLPLFHMPQPYQHPNQHPNTTDSRPNPQGSMPPPKVPFSKLQDTNELEKANAKDLDVNNISDVLTGSGIDIRAEEEAMLHTVGRRDYGASFNSQATGSTMSPHGSFNQWGQQTNHGAFRGTGVLNEPLTKQQLEEEFLQKHQNAARALNEASSQHLPDPFLYGAALRQRIAKRAYEHGISVNLEGLFDKIPENSPSNVTRTTTAGSNGDVVGLQATSLLNQNAPLVEFLSYISLAAQERVRTVLEDSFALAQGRLHTSDGIVPPNLADVAAANGKPVEKAVVPNNLSKTAWEAAPDSAISPMTVTAQKQPPNAARLPTPPSEAPPTPRPTIQITANHVTARLKRKMDDDESFEKARIAKRHKRLAGNSATPADTPIIAPLPPPEKMTKKERDRINKIGQTEEVLHRKANETASMALGKKKKYSWMTGGGAGGMASGTSTPRLNTAVGGPNGAATPSLPPPDKALMAKRRNFHGNTLESTPEGEKVQLRDLIHVLENDGRERKTLAQIMARMRSQVMDEKKVGDGPRTVGAAR